MLFNSYIFILAFLPITLCIYYSLKQAKYKTYDLAWLVLASFVFFSWWNPNLTFLLAFSVLFNFAISRFASHGKNRFWLVLGIVVNLSLLGYFKYANFFVSVVNDTSGTNWHLEEIILPIGLSFFTFQQIAYLVDVHFKVKQENSLVRYALFVTFFPQLIAGPIVHHADMMPQFGKYFRSRLILMNLAVGISIFSVGLAKKVLIADAIAPLVTPVFTAASLGTPISFFEAWSAVTLYPLQLYFDFSGYSDMALGIARMFGIVLPANFNSPFKATNIAEFWQRWHISLTRFLLDYVYEPIAARLTGRVIGWPRDSIRRFIIALAIPTLITFFLSGLWHGAGWTFIIFGFLHAGYVILFLAWRQLRGRQAPAHTLIEKFPGWLLTMATVMVAFVFFRAESVASALIILGAICGSNGISLPVSFLPHAIGHADFLSTFGIIFEGVSPNDLIGLTKMRLLGVICLIPICLAMPNTLQIFSRYTPALMARYGRPYVNISAQSSWLNLTWRPTRLWAIATGICMAFAISHLSTVTEFIYFQF